MSYAPSTFHAGTGEDFFRKEGFLVDGMAPLVTGRYTFPTADGGYGPTRTITDSVMKFGTLAGVAWMGFDFSEAKSKVLGICHAQIGAAWYGPGIGFMVGTATAAESAGGDVTAGYQAHSAIGDSATTIQERTGTWANLASDSTIYAKLAIKSPIVGIACHIDGDASPTEIKAFLQFGSTSQWFQVLSTTDTTNSSFESVYMRINSGANTRYVCPLMVWGS